MTGVSTQPARPIKRMAALTQVTAAETAAKVASAKLIQLGGTVAAAALAVIQALAVTAAVMITGVVEDLGLDKMEPGEPVVAGAVVKAEAPVLLMAAESGYLVPVQVGQVERVAAPEAQVLGDPEQLTGPEVLAVSAFQAAGEPEHSATKTTYPSQLETLIQLLSALRLPAETVARVAAQSESSGPVRLGNSRAPTQEIFNA